MAKAVTSLPSGLTIALGFLGKHGANRGSVAQLVHDGDTINVEAAGNLSVRFLEPSELRFLSRQAPGNRRLIDLSQANTNTLLHPVNYHKISNLEDRLFIPEEYVPLFVEKGWQREQV
jgi:hypothetical protein